jgi:peptidoglycan hydrolase CwlO-like protein
MFDQFTLANAIQIALVVGGFIATIVTLRVTVKFLRSDISGIQTELKKIGDILVMQADMRGEIKVLDSRINTAENSIQEMQHRCDAEHRIRA